MAARSACAVLFRHNCPTLVRNTSFPLSNVSFSVFSQRHYASSVTTEIDNSVFSEEGLPKPKKKLSKAMQAYLTRAKEHDEFMHKAKVEYEIGKRHLANMMGENPDTFTQRDINEAIRYLFPSGLFEPKARPQMLPPEKVFPPRKAAEFDESGRPFHSMFYTCKPNFHQALYDIVETLNNLNAIEDVKNKSGIVPEAFDRMQSLGSTWISKDDLENKVLENLSDKDYEQLINTLERLLEHPFSAAATDKLMEFRVRNVVQVSERSALPLKYTKDGRPFVKVIGCQRKSAKGTVTLFGNGTGKITINGQDISYFERIQHREQVRSFLFSHYVY